MAPAKPLAVFAYEVIKYSAVFYDAEFCYPEFLLSGSVLYELCAGTYTYKCFLMPKCSHLCSTKVLVEICKILAARLRSLN